MEASQDLQLNIVSLKVEVVPLARVDEGAKLEVVIVEVIFLLVTLAADSTEVLFEAAVVVDWALSPLSVVVGAKVVVAFGSCLLAGCNRPAMARLKYRQRHSTDLSLELLNNIFVKFHSAT